MKYEDIELRTHSPKGEYAANDENYERLLSRLKTEHPLRPTVSTHRSWMQRWGVAASVAILCGLACAATWQMGWLSDSTNKIPSVSEESPQVETMSFSDTPLSVVLTSICTRYNVDYEPLDPSKDIRITAVFAADESLDEILETLSMVSDLDITIKHDNIIVK